MINKKGFTLLELLVVVVIIGILAAIALPKYKLATMKTKYSTMLDMARVIKEAQDRYYMLHGDYATYLRDLDIGVGDDGNSVSHNFFECTLTWHTKAAVVCQFKNMSPTLQYSLPYSGVRGHSKYCRVYGSEEGSSNSVLDKVCQSFTGRQTPSEYIGGNIYYFK